MITDGIQPVGNGIGPSLEAMDVLAVLQNKTDAPKDLKERAIELSAALIRLSGQYTEGTEMDLARSMIENGSAYKKFIDICHAQGGFKEPVLAKFRLDIISSKTGLVTAIDNRKLARIAKLAGAPNVPTAGVLFKAPIGKEIRSGELLFSIYAESNGELDYAREYFESLDNVISIKE